MIENPGRIVALISALLVGALLSMLLPEQPFRMGLDLQGGTRLSYRFDFDEALEQGKISEDEFVDRNALLNDFSEIIRERVDPFGVYDPVIRSEGRDRLVIELPGNTAFADRQVRAQVAEPIEPTTSTLTLGGSEEDVQEFPVTGGVIEVAGEKMRYEARDGAQLRGLRRGHDATVRAAHGPGTEVLLISNDPIRRRIENVGELQFYLGAKPSDYGAQRTDEVTERRKVTEWVQANPDAPLTEFNALPADQGGPMEGLRWFPRRAPRGEEEAAPLAERLVPLVLPPERWRFDGDDLDTVGVSQDGLGFPAVSFEMKPQQRIAFGDFTEENIQEAMAIVMNDEVATLATIQDRLPGNGIISGGAKGFTREEVQELVQVLRSGSLRIKPILEATERVGATLGEDYVRMGFTGAVTGLGVVLLFILFYYRRLGLFACLSMIFTLTLLMGALAFLRATLTLPGIAGIILTVGMAIDANILIYERIREERLRGSKLVQAAKAGFQHATSAIVDSNLTTLITGFVLLQLGTGPVRGFATTLIIGILATMFSALVVTRLLVHFALERGATEFTMVRWVADTKIAFMRKTKYALLASAVVVVAGVGLFIAQPDRQKLGIDFLGGFQVTVRTEEPQSTDRIRELIRQDPGLIGQTAEVRELIDSGSRGEGYTSFRITYKSSGELENLDEEESREQTGETVVRDLLEPVLQRGPVELTVAEPPEEGARPPVSGRLYFEENHPAADVQALLAEAGLEEAAATPVAGRVGIFDVSGRAAPGADELDLERRLTRALEGASDSAGVDYMLSNAVPESSLVGAQVVGELRDKAIIAILVSLFMAVLYIRVRFAEYAYGLAAVAAIVHDVLIVLGFLALADLTKIVDGQITLPMIAAFLTIIGYSLNDTIVIFDRVRENLPRMKKPLEEVLDISINQTLSRTLLTSFTTLLAVLVLFLFNVGSGNVLEGFAFAMLIGIVTGAYSTLFIATPAFLWLEKRNARKEGGLTPAQEKARKPAAASSAT